VRIAVMKYVQPKTIPDVSEALLHLFDSDIEPRLDEAAKLDPNQDLRSASRCYNEEVDTVLRSHEKSLRALFDGYGATAAATEGHVTAKLEAKLLAYDEWMQFVTQCGLLDIDVSAREATMAFARARMRYIDEESLKGKIKATQLSFEDFLEALCQLALLKSLPTDEEIAQTGEQEEIDFLDGGDCLIYLHDCQPAVYEELMRAHPGSWGAAPRQPVQRCVDHAVTLAIRTVKLSVAVGCDDPMDMVLTAAEIKRFLKGDKSRKSDAVGGAD